MGWRGWAFKMRSEEESDMSAGDWGWRPRANTAGSTTSRGRDLALPPGRSPDLRPGHESNPGPDGRVRAEITESPITDIGSGIRRGGRLETIVSRHIRQRKKVVIDIQVRPIHRQQ